MVAVSNPPITVAELRERFSYNPDTGVLIRIMAEGREQLGLVNSDHIQVMGFRIAVNRLCWVIHNGRWTENLVDHANRNKKDNCAVNLREATHTQNQYNKVQSNIHGYKGVTWRDRKKKPWLAKIRVNGTRINLGSFETKEEAARVYEEACIKYHGEFAQLGVA